MRELYGVLFNRMLTVKVPLGRAVPDHQVQHPVPVEIGGSKRFGIVESSSLQGRPEGPIAIAEEHRDASSDQIVGNREVREPGAETVRKMHRFVPRLTKETRVIFWMPKPARLAGQQ